MDWVSLLIGAICMTILFVCWMFAYYFTQDKKYGIALILCLVGFVAGIIGWVTSDVLNSKIVNNKQINTYIEQIEA